MKTLALVAAVSLAGSAFAQDMPVPKMFKGMEGQKGQYQVEVVEGAGGRKMPPMTICTDSLMRQSSGGAAKDKPRGDPSCKYRLLKDTADEAVMETACPDRTSKITMKREGKSTLMTIDSDRGAKGPTTMKMRYTHLGACQEGQGAVTMDRNSEQCKKVRERAAKMDPVKSCARTKDDREACEQRMRDTAAQLRSMCG